MIKAKTQHLMLLRVSKGWSKSDLAKHSELSPSAVVKIEGGKNASAKAAKKIADALQVEVSEIFTITNE